MAYPNSPYQDPMAYYTNWLAQAPKKSSKAGGVINPWGGFGGYEGVPGGHYGQQFGQAAGQILQGSAQADRSMMDAYRELYRTRTEGIAGAYGLMQQRAAGQAAAQGIAPDLLQRGLTGARAGAIQGLGQARGEMLGQYGLDRAQLLKGTGTELAGLKMAEINTELQRYLGKKAAKAAKSAGAMQMFGSLAGGMIGM